MSDISSPSDGPSLPRDTRFETQPYQAEGGFNLNGMLFLTGGMVVASFLLGIIVFFIAKGIYLILFFPIAIGSVLGIIGKRLVRKCKVRSPRLAGLVGLLSGMVAMTTTHYCNYLDFMSDLSVNREQIERLGQMAPQEFPQALLEDGHDPALYREWAKTHSFWGYLNLEARKGVTIRRIMERGKGLNLGYTLTWMYWIAESFIVALLVFLIVRGEAQEPYCSITDQWKSVLYSKRFLVGDCLNAESAGIMLRDGELGRIAEAKFRGGSEGVQLDVYSSLDHSPESTLDAKLTEIVAKKDGTFQEVVVTMATYPQHALIAFEKLCS